MHRRGRRAASYAGLPACLLPAYCKQQPPPTLASPKDIPSLVAEQFYAAAGATGEGCCRTGTSCFSLLSQMPRLSNPPVGGTAEPLTSVVLTQQSESPGDGAIARSVRTVEIEGHHVQVRLGLCTLPNLRAASGQRRGVGTMVVLQRRPDQWLPLTVCGCTGQLQDAAKPAARGCGCTCQRRWRQRFQRPQCLRCAAPWQRPRNLDNGTPRRTLEWVPCRGFCHKR